MVLVDVKQKLILCLWDVKGSIIKEVYKGCESDFMETLAQAGGYRCG